VIGRTSQQSDQHTMSGTRSPPDTIFGVRYSVFGMVIDSALN